MSVPEYILTDFLHMEENELPRYDKKLDETYCSIMSKLYLPTNTFFTNTVKKAYKENLQSAILAELAGKKYNHYQEMKDNIDIYVKLWYNTYINL